MRTEELTKCCELLQKMRVRLELSKIDLPPPHRVIYITDLSKAILLLWFFLFLCFGVEFLCCLNLMYVFIILVKFG